MGAYTDFENWRDDLYCGGEPPREYVEAELGATYELYDAINSRIEELVVCTPENKSKIESSLNDDMNDMWWWRKHQRR